MKLSKIAYGYAGDGIYWFRVLGYGLHWKDTRRHPLLFSQRLNITKYLRIGSWVITTLKPHKRNGPE